MGNIPLFIDAEPKIEFINCDLVKISGPTADGVYCRVMPRSLHYAYVKKALAAHEAYMVKNGERARFLADGFCCPTATLAPDGSYAFARNVLVAIMDDLLEQGADQTRLERIVQRLAEANECIADAGAKVQADAEASYLLALLRTHAD